METREERALKIAEYDGWFCYSPEPEWLGNAKQGERISTESGIIVMYSYLHALMEIFCEIHSSDDFRIDIIAGAVDISGYNDKIGETYSFTDPETLIDALQKAIIFYYANRS